ncbi:MAG: hypothetical protein IJH12_09105 [Clostridia bacterium]|nr:hypothetical protein [Clostridia bacterium]
MAKKVSKQEEKSIPKAVRIIGFTEEDIATVNRLYNGLYSKETPAKFVEKDGSTFVRVSSECLIPKEIWAKFAKKATVYTDVLGVTEYAEEYPIVMYQCDELACYEMQPDYRLNAFVKRITVSALVNGRRAGFSAASEKTESEIVEKDMVVYYENNFGLCSAVIQEDIFQLLIKKPKLVVSPEGVLIFFNDREILATVDGYHYYWINSNVIDVDDKRVVDIEVHDDYCKVILTKDGANEEFKLKFGIDMTAHIMILPEVSTM